MNCYICKGVCGFEVSTGDYEYIKCKCCGEYKISGSAVEMLKTRKVDVGEMKLWLLKQRDDGDEVPVILSTNMKFKGV